MIAAVNNSKAEGLSPTSQTTMVSVCIPVHNREHLVAEAVKSALAQTVSGLEVIVVDNASTDRTWEVVNSFSDPRLTLCRNEANLGLFGNFNRCLELARGKYLRILCSDDRLLPGCLAQEVELMETNPGVVLLSSPGWTVDESYRRIEVVGNHMKPGTYPGESAVLDVLWICASYCYNPLNWPSGILIRRRAVLTAGRFDQSMLFKGDLDYWLRILRFGELAISAIPACEVMIHRGQEGNKFRDPGGQQIVELIQVTNLWAEQLQNRGVYREMIRRFSGLALWRAFAMWRSGLVHSARTYLELPRQNGVSLLSSVLAFLEILCYRLLRRLFGTCFTLSPRHRRSMSVCMPRTPGWRGEGKRDRL